jgi:peptidoglycan/xylan/chitin deacetylase (PgdA/CDA1 family)
LALFLCGCDPSRGVPIFLWHSVGEGSPDDFRDVPVDEFDHELSEIEAHGATPITLDQLFDAREGKAQLPKQPVVITFDDGRACLLSGALPVLKKHHMVAEAFLISGFLGEDEAHRHVEHDEQGTHPYLLWSEARQLAESGAFRIESHSVHHLDMAGMSESDQRHEMLDSRTALHERLGAPVDFFAYPFGAFDHTNRDIAEATGYRGAVTVQSGLGSRYAMKRTSLHRGYPNLVEQTLDDAFGQVRR